MTIPDSPNLTTEVLNWFDLVAGTVVDETIFLVTSSQDEELLAIDAGRECK